ncbi:MAG: RdgB/HAM1 family non-canonical purine NTP pyrophosphatase [Terriglobales bacterium]
MKRILIATSNPGKLRDFAAAAAPFDIEIAPVPDIRSLPPAREDAPTFEANACKKAEHYSRYVPGENVLADDSGLSVDALDGAPGVRSARYAADAGALEVSANAIDAANNRRLLKEMSEVEDHHRGAAFVCCIAVARNGRTVACFRGQVNGIILRELRGSGGFGYDPLFYVPTLGKTFAEVTAEEKASLSHRGQAFRKFLQWYAAQPENEMVSRSASSQTC